MADDHFRTGFSYFECQACASKVNCEKCGKDIQEGLMKTGLVSSALVDMNSKEIFFETDPASEDEVIDYLEGIGVFI